MVRGSRTAALADYPAAHSMDTTWFAVDADGHVGVFESSEDGAVPNAAATGGGAAEPSFDMFLLNAVRAVRAFAPEPPSPDGARIIDHHFPKRARVVLVLAEPVVDGGPATYRSANQSKAESLVADFEPLVLGEARPRAIATTKPLDDDRMFELSGHPDVVELWTEHDLGEVLGEPCGQDGFFAFHHDYGDEYSPGRYARSAVPEHPFALDALPSPVREHVGAFKLPIRFADAERLQLADHLRDEEASIWAHTTLRGEPLPGDDPRTATARARAQRSGSVATWAWTIVLVVVVLLFLAFRR